MLRDVDSLKLLIQSRIPLVFIRSRDEERAMHLVTRTAIALNEPVFRWTATEGLLRLETVDAVPQRLNIEPQAVLGHIRALTLGGIFVLLDFHNYLDDPMHRRLLKDIALGYARAPRTVILVSADITVPEELRTLSAELELSLPTPAELRTIVQLAANEWMEQNGGRRVRADAQALDLLIRNLSGLTAADAKRLARIAVHDGVISRSDLPQVMKAKYQLLDQNGVLTFEYNTAPFSQVGGLAKLKRWLELRKPVFLNPVNQPGLDAPKGVLLLGVQGSGKSLAAKATAGLFGVPLLRLDFGSLYNKYHGETERNLREALKTAEVMAPCVLWLDEFEKGLSSADDDQGTSRRVLATVLTWMSERKAPVFLAATANDIGRLPPELLRKGRFDEIFFVDLPHAEVRAEIFRIHLQQRQLDPEMFGLAQLAAASDGFSGAEIEQAIVAGLYAAHARNVKLKTEQLLEEIRQTKPLSVVMAERVSALRAWAAERTVPAD
jgi:SpoVK/Ycf46/Vps4 family AAA+-type ATPase